MSDIFQFTPLREGLPARSASIPIPYYFNSRPCERGFCGRLHERILRAISIHAPARGASIALFQSIPEYTFQFTPLREGLRPAHAVPYPLLHFNSRPCERGFRIPVGRIWIHFNFNSRPCERGFSTISPYISGIMISIHAPARGASEDSSHTGLEDGFQFTPLREGLRMGKSNDGRAWNFNSRPCERGFNTGFCNS